MGNYIMFAKPSYGEGDFDLTISRSGVYASGQLSRKEAMDLLNDIHRALELDIGRTAEWGDLHAGTGIDDPDDILF